METGQIAKVINGQGLFIRRDWQPKDGKMVSAVARSHPETFYKNEDRSGYGNGSIYESTFETVADACYAADGLASGRFCNK